MAGHERPEVVRVVGASYAKPAVFALAAIVALIGTAVWKPWPSSSDPRAGQARAVVAAQPVITSASPAQPPEPAVVTVEGVQPILGLDTSIMGQADGHEAWGVAAAYVPVS